MKNILPFISLLLLLVNSIFPYVAVSNVFAEEATPSATEIISPVPSATPIIEPTATPIPSPDPSPTLTPVVSVEPTPTATLTPTTELSPSLSLSPIPEQTPSAQSLWQEQEDKSNKTNTKVEINKDYQDPKNDKVKIKFNKLPETSGFLTIKEIKLSADQVAQTKSISDIAYEITSDMTNGTFEYDLTLPLPFQAQNKEIKVKAAENEAKLPGASELNEQKEKLADTIIIKGLNHFTVFVITTPDPDTVQRVLINEIAPTAGTEWVELYNNGTASVNLAAGTGWVIRNSVGDSQSLAALGAIAPAGRAVFNTPAAWLSDTAPETVSILNELGSTIDTVTISLTAPGFAVDHYPLAGESVGRKTDGISEWIIFTSPSKGAANIITIPSTGLAEVGSTSVITTFPAWYKDSNGLALDLMEAADPNGISAPIDSGNAFSSQIGFGGEGFWFSADASMPTSAGSADLIQGVEASFAPAAVATDGLQSAFTRIRIRIDVTDAGTYTVTYPYGQKTYVVTTPGTRAINDTVDIGCFDKVTCNSSATPNYSTVLTGEIGPFLTWTTFNTDPALSDPLLTNATTGRRYVGLGTTDHAVKGSPTGNNFFRVQGPNIGGPGINSIQTNLFVVTGRLADASAPVITLHGSNPVNATLNSTYIDAGATAIDDQGGNLTGSIIVTGLPVDTATLGAKTVTYAVTDGAGRTSSTTRTVNVIAAGGVDTTAPVITLVGTSPVSVVAGTPYTDAGATALDNVDGNITANIVTTNPVNTAVIGTYTVTYNVSDAALNAAAPVTRIVNVVADTVAPVITVTGSNPVNLLTGAPYTDAGATATDNVDGNLTASIITTGLPVNTVVPGTFTVTYTVSDAAGNSASATRTVNVVNTITGSLAAVSTINSANGYPTWYKDSAGIALQLCLAGANDLADANCILPAAGEEPNFNPTQAVLFPANFPGESFWYIADSDVAPAGQTGAGRVRLRYALEGAFTTAAPTVDQQIAFLRVNMQRIADLVPGATYTVIHPFGQFTMHAGDALLADGVTPNPDAGVADDGGFFRLEDGAFAAPLTNITAASFLSAATTHISKFLKQINPVPPAGYIGDGATLSTIEAGPNGNFIRITGPNIDVNNYDGDGNPNSLTINTWTVSGKLADTTAPVITVTGSNPVDIAQNAVYTDVGATAADDFDGNITASIVTTGLPLDTTTVGAKTITYTATDRAGNTATATRTVNVTGVDTTAPVITRLGMSPVSVTVGSVYTDAGAIALDNVDGNLTASIVTVNPVNSNVIGTYTVTYNVSDAVGNTATEVSRTVNVVAAPVVDTIAPVITLLGVSPVDVTQNTVYTDAGATALDNIDGNITANIVTANPVNTAVIGTYTVTYNVSDAAGNPAIPATRTVNVVATVPATISGSVFHDINANKIKDAGEPFLSGWTIFLDTNTNKALDAGEISVVSDALGNYQFSNLSTGTYNINEVIQTNWGIRLPGGNGYTQTVAAGNNIIGKDFGNIVTRVVPGQTTGGFVTTTGTTITPSVIAIADSVISVPSNGGTSTVSVPADTVIATSTGEVFDAATLAASDPAGTILSGLGTGVAVKGKIQWGIPNLGLTFSSPINLDIFVGTDLNGRTLDVLRSVDGTTGWTNNGIVAPGKCVVALGICSFQATKASFYVAAEIPAAALIADGSAGSNNSGGDGGNGSSTQAPQCNDAYAGSAPTLLSAKATGANEVTLTWEKAKDPVTHYVVSYGLEAGKPLYGNPNIGGKDITSYTVKGLSGGTTYYFRVRAGNGCNAGDYSNEMSAAATGGVISGPASGFSSGVLGTATEDNSGNNESGNTGIGTNENTESNVLGQSSLLGDNKIANQSQNSNNSGLSKTTIVVIVIGILAIFGSVIYYLRRKAFVN